MSKDTRKISQLKATFVAFFSAPKTRLEVAQETQILRANICRYVDTLRKRGVIKVVRKDDCPITRHKAEFLTTNPVFFPPTKQMKIWE